MKPQLVKNKDTGMLALQISQGSHSATLDLPSDFKDWPPDRKEIFIERFVHEATKNLKMKSPFKRKFR